jgi:hypothetical protein
VENERTVAVELVRTTIRVGIGIVTAAVVAVGVASLAAQASTPAPQDSESVMAFGGELSRENF